jgi:hypothetical protein
MILKCRWKLLDFALLKRSSVSFFDIEKPETAVSKWSRARMRAAKVGKVLSDIIITSILWSCYMIFFLNFGIATFEATVLELEHTALTQL